MEKPTPSTTYIMQALPLANGRFHALYSAPGLVPDIARAADGRPYEYDTELEAEHGAAQFLYSLKNNIRRKAKRSKPERYAKITGPEFAALLARSTLTPTLFAYLYGTSQQRVLDWIDDADGVPHPARVLLELFIADEKNIDVAESVTDKVTTERSPRK